MQFPLQHNQSAHIWVVTHHQYGISALIPHVENIEIIGDPKCWLSSQATTNTPFDFHIFIYYLQVDKLKLSNTSTTQPTEEKQANTEEEDNGTNKMQAQCSVIYTFINTKTPYRHCLPSTEQTKATDLADASFLMKVLRSKLVKTKNEVEVQRNDPSSPLHSVKSFEELPL